MIIILIGAVTVLLLLLLLYKYYKIQNNFIENFYLTKQVTIDCVVARYNESIKWITMPEFSNVTRFIIYNKGKPLRSLPNNAIEIMLPNVGKCDHTFLHHIIFNYNKLADVTLFVSGRADDKRKGPKIINTMKYVNNTHDSVFIGYGCIIPDYEYYFTLQNYLSANPENQVRDGKITRVTPAKIRPFGNWFNFYWPNKNATIIAYQSIFAVHKRHIIQHSIDYYIRLYEEVNYDVNPEAGHFLERAWSMIFSPYPSQCNYYTNKFNGLI